MPSVLTYTYFIAFGFNTEIPHWFKHMCVIFEVIYGLEIITNYITAYID
jgi:hypothetical protein